MFLTNEKKKIKMSKKKNSKKRINRENLKVEIIWDFFLIPNEILKLLQEKKINKKFPRKNDKQILEDRMTEKFN